MPVHTYLEASSVPALLPLPEASWRWDASLRPAPQGPAQGRGLRDVTEPARAPGSGTSLGPQRTHPGPACPSERSAFPHRLGSRPVARGLATDHRLVPGSRLDSTVSVHGQRTRSRLDRAALTVSPRSPPPASFLLRIVLAALAPCISKGILEFLKRIPFTNSPVSIEKSAGSAGDGIASARGLGGTAFAQSLSLPSLVPSPPSSSQRPGRGARGGPGQREHPDGARRGALAVSGPRGPALPPPHLFRACE